jgi:hypothetical protein
MQRLGRIICLTNMILQIFIYFYHITNMMKRNQHMVECRKASILSVEIKILCPYYMSVKKLMGSDPVIYLLLL